MLNCDIIGCPGGFCEWSVTKDRKTNLRANSYEIRDVRKKVPNINDVCSLILNSNTSICCLIAA